MKILNQKTDRKTGKVTMSIELDKGETLIAVHDSAFYELGEPLNDVVHGHIIAQARPAHWCVVAQKFIT